MAPRRSFGEFDGIEVLTAHLGAAASTVAAVGIGDDAAVLRRPKGEVVLSVDASIEGVHFDRSWLSLEQAAARSFHAAVSDLAAMGASAWAAVCALELPRGCDRRAMAAIGRGQARAANDLACPVVGGNVTSGPCFGFTTTVLGTLVGTKPLLRSGARPGDEVWLSHEAGWAGLGLHLLQRGLATRVGRSLRVDPSVTGRWPKRALQAWTTPRAKMKESQLWRSRVHSLIDTSDSVGSEAEHLAAASGVRVVLDAELILATHRTLVLAAEQLGLNPLTAVLYGGEDYGLLGTGPAKKRPPGAIVVGRVTVGRGAVLRVGDSHQPLLPGFDHLRT